jgi:hypothetical protein
VVDANLALIEEAYDGVTDVTAAVLAAAGSAVGSISPNKPSEVPE